MMLVKKRSNVQTVQRVVRVLINLFITIQLVQLLPGTDNHGHIFSPVLPSIQLVHGASESGPTINPDHMAVRNTDSFQTRFRGMVRDTVEKLKLILADARHPTHASDVPHSYGDKYELAEWLTNTAVAAQLNALELLGLDETALSKMVHWSRSGMSVSLRLSTQHSHEFVREETRQVPDDSVELVTSVIGSYTRQTVHTVHDYYHRFGLSYHLQAFPGADPSTGITLIRRKSEVEFVAKAKLHPPSQKTDAPDLDVNISWLLKHFDDEKTEASSSDGIRAGSQVDRRYNFTIDRNAESCRTPRRNEQIDEAIAFGSALYRWCAEVSVQIGSFIRAPYSNFHFPKLFQQGQLLFNPIAPLLEAKSIKEKQEVKTRKVEQTEEEQRACMDQVRSDSSSSKDVCSQGQVERAWETESPARLLSPSDVSLLLQEQQRTLRVKLESYADKVAEPSSSSELLTMTDVRLLLGTHHLHHLLDVYEHSLYSIEAMIHDQLVAAVGKELTSEDFDEFMRFHYNQLFREEFRPKPFVFAVRRPEHYPEGIISIEAKPRLDSMKPDQPIPTTVRTLTEKDGPAAVGAMSFPLSASTRVSFSGDRYLHSYLAHEFASPAYHPYPSSESPSQKRINRREELPEVTLKCRSRAFSSYIVLLGTMSSSQMFDPSHAFILQNKEEMEIPLTLTQIPSAAAFESAISNLSDEQQRFAKAIRAMQLESSLFAILLIQLKPALEVLLHLPADSLTKEIQLTQDLLELFIEYQIPSDLLTFDGAANATRTEKIDHVKGYVKNIQSMIEAAKKDKLKEAKVEAEYIGTKSLRKIPKNKDPVHLLIMKKSMEFAKTKGKIDKAGSTPQQLRQPSSAKTPTDSYSSPSSASTALDLTALPGELDKRFLAMDHDSALRSTTINVKEVWNKFVPDRYISRGTEGSSTAILNMSMQDRERNRAFDLIDALSRSGSIPLNSSSLHIIIATTHAFDRSLISTVVQKNINPIEKLDRSVLLIANLIQNKTIEELVEPNKIPHLIKFNPDIKQLMGADASNHLELDGTVAMPASPDSSSELLQSQGVETNK